MKIASTVPVTSVNARVHSPEAFVRTAEENYSFYIEEAARRIASCPEKPVLLLSGPSGAGKTTTALRIERRLEEMGYTVHTLSMDNYFLPVTDESMKALPRDDRGNIDLESPHRLDIHLFREHLGKLAAGEAFAMPVFDFATQSRVRTIPFCRKKDEKIIIEGIHALNPQVTGNADRFALCMYISVRTRLRRGDGALLHPRYIRLMRRLCRDRLFRKRSAEETLRMLESVTRGEELYIMPYKERSEMDIDTFMAYEVPVYKPYLEHLLREEGAGRFPEQGLLLSFLEELAPLDTKYVPAPSLIREFIGGSELQY